MSFRFLFAVLVCWQHLPAPDSDIETPPPFMWLRRSQIEGQVSVTSTTWYMCFFLVV